jgi:hypothetical protein
MEVRTPNKGVFARRKSPHKRLLSHDEMFEKRGKRVRNLAFDVPKSPYERIILLGG